MMKNYRHMMEQVALSDQKKEEIMEMIENKQTKKHRIPKAGKIVLAAALAVGCVAMIAAGLPMQAYYFLNGGMTAIDGGGTNVGAVWADESNDLLVLENNRLWFVNGEERTDITDLIDEDTPYIYERTDPATGNKGYVILGGTVDDFGWAEYANLGDGYSMMGKNSFDNYVTLDGVRLNDSTLTPEQIERLNQTDCVPLETVFRPWHEAARNLLGFTGEP